MNNPTEPRNQEVIEPNVQPRDQYVPQVREESRPAAVVLDELREDAGSSPSSGMFIP